MQSCAWISDKTPFHTCGACDYDIFKPCFEIEFLPPDEGSKEYERCLDVMAARNEALLLQYENEEKVPLDRENRCTCIREEM